MPQDDPPRKLHESARAHQRLVHRVARQRHVADCRCPFCTAGAAGPCTPSDRCPDCRADEGR